MIKYLNLALVIVICTACSNVDKNVYGNWGALEIYHGQQELSNNSGKTYLTPQLTILNRGNQFLLDFNDRRMNEYGHYKFNGDKLLELSEMPSPFLNGVYDLSIIRTQGTDQSRSKTFELTMKTDSVYIRAIKYVTKI